jgi:hypothetical protein
MEGSMFNIIKTLEDLNTNTHTTSADEARLI